MIRFFSAVAFLLAAIGANAQQTPEVHPLVIGEIRNLKSDALQEERTLNIYLPPGYDTLSACPVIYLLDGSMNEDFIHITGLVQFFNLTFNMPPAIVVGIANIDRRRDFTFPTDNAGLKKDFPTTGHSAAFIRFLGEELLPFIDETYKTTDTRYIVGQSLGGLLATEVLLKQPSLFTHYLIVSPSLWWDDESLLKKAKPLLERWTSVPKFVYVSVGNDEEAIMKKDAAALVTLLRSKAGKNMRLEFSEMIDENHATILHNSIYKALQVLFPYK